MRIIPKHLPRSKNPMPNRIITQLPIAVAKRDNKNIKCQKMAIWELHTMQISSFGIGLYHIYVLLIGSNRASAVVTGQSTASHDDSGDENLKVTSESIKHIYNILFSSFPPKIPKNQERYSTNIQWKETKEHSTHTFVGFKTSTKLSRSDLPATSSWGDQSNP